MTLPLFLAQAYAGPGAISITLIVLIILLIGGTVALLILGGRDYLEKRYQDDIVWMRQTSLRFNPEPINAVRWVHVSYVLALVVLVLLVLNTPNPIVGIGLWIVLLFVPKVVVEILWNRRKHRINEQLPATIAAMCNSIRAGLTLVQAIQRLGEQAPDPIRSEFKIMASRYAYGADLEHTILEAKQRLAMPNFNLFASALLMNREMGGDIAATLQRISISLDKIRQMKMTVEAHTSEGRTNIKVLLVAPVVMLLMVSTVDPDGVHDLFTTPQGYAVVLLAALLTGAGVYFAAKITRSDV